MPSKVAPMASSALRDASLSESVLNSTRWQCHVPNAWSSISSFASELTVERCQGTATHVQPISTRRSASELLAKRVLPITRPVERSTGKSRRRAQSEDPPSLSALGLEELEHPLVCSTWLALERPGHQIGDVEVTDADRIGIAQRAKGDLRGRPRADPRNGPQAAVGGVQRMVDELLQPARV